MYLLRALHKGKACDANDNHVDVEVIEVQDTVTKETVNLCPKCFLAQLRLRSKGRKTNGDGQPVLPFAEQV